MRNLLVTLCFLFLLPLITIAQNPGYVNREWKEGMFKTFSELKLNEPSLPILGEFKRDTVKVKLALWKTLRIPAAKFVFNSKKEKSRLGKKHKSLFAVCKNGKVYIPRENYLFFNYVNYFELTFLSNEYAIYRGYNIGNGNTYEYNGILDMNTGKLSILSKKFLKKLVKDNAILLKKLKKTPNRELNEIEFLKDFIEMKS
ncbi:hypothetical protein JM84_0621 [Dokdonia sp. Hel_I_63]|uniref:hypothetical protein n=1 Tax=unclassified Dokdonia TaxID=2615033 RepID=UPI00020A69F5|nr:MULTISPECIES: hypothetical protein [unclassified Dokdonia]AEE19025.1 hypothetical protein Krodi_1041 [Dokdonia sp. 4H-3-7-5]TVZ21743.1 hypothetical protein JM84_0621 [Dokdonia sp. Hel_I_63]